MFVVATHVADKYVMEVKSLPTHGMHRFQEIFGGLKTKAIEGGTWTTHGDVAALVAFCQSANMALSVRLAARRRDCT